MENKKLVIKKILTDKQVNHLKSLTISKVEKKPIKAKYKQSIAEMVSANFANDVKGLSKEIPESSIQNIINTSHPDIKQIINFNNVTEYKVTVDCLLLTLNTGISVEIQPRKDQGHIQIYNGIRTKHIKYANRYIIKDKKGKILINKIG